MPVRSRCVPLLFVLLFFSLFTTGAWAQLFGSGLETMQLLSPEVGWASTRGRLYWTTTGGADWNDITPFRSKRDKTVAVFFLDRLNGWVLLSSWDEATDSSNLNLASTNSGGKTWSIVPLSIPRFDKERMSLGGGGRIYFLDTARGWLNLDLVSSSNFRLGILLTTEDGGRNWNWVTESPGVAGEIRFITATDGWLAGGPADGQLFVTHDGSNSWQEVSLKPPSQILPATYPTYGPPVFKDQKRGFLPVSYSGPEGSSSALVLFATEDGGTTWSADRSLLGLKESSRGQMAPSAIIDSGWIVATISNRTHLTLTKVMPSGKNSLEVLLPGLAVLGLSFVDMNFGWALVANDFKGIGPTRRVLSTRDGGRTWTEITPGSKPSGTALQPRMGH